MAGDWVKLAPKIEERPQFRIVESRLNTSSAELFLALYRLADWFHRHSDYGQMPSDAFNLIDRVVKADGLAKALKDVGWIRINDETVTLFGFAEASAVRKSLGRKVRDEVLSSGKCAACGSRSDLVIDHIVPIVRGGSSHISNLQALCASCNRSKGRKLPSEWGGRNG